MNRTTLRSLWRRSVWRGSFSSSLRVVCGWEPWNLIEGQPQKWSSPIRAILRGWERRLKASDGHAILPVLDCFTASTQGGPGAVRTPAQTAKAGALCSSPVVLSTYAYHPVLPWPRLASSIPLPPVKEMASRSPRSVLSLLSPIRVRQRYPWFLLQRTGGVRSAARRSARSDIVDG